jgi:hypothetical protein
MQKKKKKCLIMQGHLEEIKKTHLRDLMKDAERCKSMMVYDSPLNLLVAMI